MRRLKSADKAHTFPATRESGWHATVSGCCASLVGIGEAVCVSVRSPNRSYRLCSRRQMLPEPPR
jgi:hypothetical protein